MKCRGFGLGVSSKALQFLKIALQFLKDTIMEAIVIIHAPALSAWFRIWQDSKEAWSKMTPEIAVH